MLYNKIINIFTTMITHNDKYDFFFLSKNRKLLTKDYLSSKYPEIYNEVVSFSDKYSLNDIPFKQIIYHYVFDLKEKPTCLECDKHTNFLKPVIRGYSKYCSMKCQNNAIDVIKKRKETCIEKYGVDNPSKNTDIINKKKADFLAKHGVENPLQVKEFRDKQMSSMKDRHGVKFYSQSDEYKDKVKKTSKEKYGVDHFSKSDEVKNKIQKTNIERYGDKSSFKNESVKEKYKLNFKNKYGVINPFQLESVKEKSKETCIEKYGVDSFIKSEEYQKSNKKNNLDNIVYKYKGIHQFINYNEVNDTLDFNCGECNSDFTIERSLFTTRGYKNLNLCTICNPKSSITSGSEIELYHFIESLNIGDIIKNDRKILNGKELDIYIPSHNLAIEYNGLYWHSELYLNNSYHLNKTKICEANNIRLIQIFEDEWIHKKEIVKSRIRNILGLNGKKIYARKCTIKLVDKKVVKDFLNENHIQGNTNSNINIGLYYNDELISLMTFGSLRKVLGSKSETNKYELIRFCNKLNVSVIGGASRLLTYFIKIYQPKEIISYADMRWSQGDLYNKLGFKYIKDTPPNYFYIIKNERKYRFLFRKDKLIKDGYDSSLTEKEIMFNRNIYRIYDCGSKKYLLAC